MAALSLPAFWPKLFQGPPRFGEFPLEAHVLIDEGRHVDVAFMLHFACRPDDGQLPHAIRPAPALNDNLFTATLKDPLVLHEPRYRFVSRTTLQVSGRRARLPVNIL